jgi:peptidyl-lysine (3S)-dioxygenase / protease
MSPVDVQRPDLVRFPRFAHARAVTCTIGPGDALFLPAHWWHEVTSSPDPRPPWLHPRNVAINYWYAPVWTKPYPCATCPLALAPEYEDVVVGELAP